jgi:glycosyltransferase involved in cell wall biosynthesis
MKILWLAHRDPLNPKAGGAERTIYEVATRLFNKGHNITLLTGGWQGCKRNEYFQGITIQRFGKNVGPHIVLPILLKKEKFDVVINDLGHAVPWLSPTILNRSNIAFFRHLHSRSLLGQVTPLLAKGISALEKCYSLIYHDTIFVTESTTSRDDLLDLRIRSTNIVMNPPGVNSNIFHPMPKTVNPSMVYFGGMRRYKRPEEAVYLLKSLIDSITGIKLNIVGSGPEEGNIKKLVNELNLQDFVSFNGRLSDMELSNVVASSWLNVHTSITEGWGYSILEAAASGTPTVAYDVPGVKDAIEEGKNGIKIVNGDRRLLSEAAYKILSNPQMWWSSSIEVAKKYSWDKTADIWEKLILEVSNNERIISYRLKSNNSGSN